jgi:DNA-binding beta-propeller fold protein YncE
MHRQFGFEMGAWEPVGEGIPVRLRRPFSTFHALRMMLCLVALGCLVGCGGGGYSNQAPPPANPNPTTLMGSLTPSSAVAGGAAFTLTITGTNFISSSTLQWNGSPRPTTFVSSTELQAAITAADISTPGTAQVSVSTPGPGGGMTGALTFTIVPKALVSLQVTPGNPSITTGTTQQFTATGTFNDGSKQDLTASAAWSSSNTTVATINSSGLATAVAIGRPKVTATSGSLSASTTLISVAGPAAAAPRFAYVTNLNDDTLSIYAVNAATGQLRANGYIQTGSSPNSVCFDPSGKFVYVTNANSNNVSAFVVDSANESLTPVAGSPFAAGSSPFAGTVDPSGTFVYVTNFQSANIPRTSSTALPVR